MASRDNRTHTHPAPSLARLTTPRANEVRTSARPRTGTRGSHPLVRSLRFAAPSCPRRPTRARASRPCSRMVRRGSTVRVRQRASQATYGLPPQTAGGVLSGMWLRGFAIAASQAAPAVDAASAPSSVASPCGSALPILWRSRRVSTFRSVRSGVPTAVRPAPQLLAARRTLSVQRTAAARVAAGARRAGGREIRDPRDGASRPFSVRVRAAAARV